MRFRTNIGAVIHRGAILKKATSLRLYFFKCPRRLDLKVFRKVKRWQPIPGGDRKLSILIQQLNLHSLINIIVIQHRQLDILSVMIFKQLQWGDWNDESPTSTLPLSFF